MNLYKKRIISVIMHDGKCLNNNVRINNTWKILLEKEKRECARKVWGNHNVIS
jgi:hypothetical protein